MSVWDLGPRGGTRKPRIVAWGELLWDLFPSGPLLGGSAANVAYHAARLGSESWLLSAVGDDSLGHAAIQQMRKASVHVEGVSVEKSAPTGRVRVELVGGEPLFSIEQDVAWDRISPSETTRARIAESDVFCISTLAQRTPLMRSMLRQELRRVRQGSGTHVRSAAWGGAPRARPLVLLDLNLRPPFVYPMLVRELLAASDIVKLNEAELEWLRTLSAGRAPLDWLFSEFGVRLVALTRGAKGASLYGRHVRIHQSGIPVSGGDPVGAGDSFVAALAVALCQGHSLSRVLEMANRYASWVASSDGAMPGAPLANQRADR